MECDRVRVSPSLPVIKTRKQATIKISTIYCIPLVDYKYKSTPFVDIDYQEKDE